MTKSREPWSSLEIKTKIAYISAIAAFILGWALTIAGFIVPPLGVVGDSVLWILGQALVYSASVFGVGLYVTGAVKHMRSNIHDFMAEEDRKYRLKEEVENEDRPKSEIE